jgi:hypothetical protein
MKTFKHFMFKPRWSLIDIIWLYIVSASLTYNAVVGILAFFVYVCFVIPLESIIEKEIKDD